MTQVVFSGSSGTIPNLNQNFTQLYDLREYISTPGYTAATPKASIAAGTFAWTFSTAVSMSSTLGVTGAATFSSTVGVTGAATFSSSLLLTGSGGLGYGTGAGGSVTQITSKSTAVTLNKLTGSITMHNASLAANTSVSFTLNNSLFGASDTMVVHVYGATTSPANYSVRPTGGAAGSISITLKNETAGSLSDTVVLTYAIIKAASS